MKKTGLTALLVGSVCAIACGLSGCFMQALEKDVTIVAQNGETIVRTDAVNIFNNAILPGSVALTQEQIDNDLEFRGWSYIENWQKGDPESALFAANGVIHYDDVKDVAQGDVVVLYPIVGKIEEKDYSVYIAWYNKESTSAMNQTMADKLLAGLKTYLSQNGVSQEQINKIVFKGFAGNVGPSTEEILKDMKSGYFSSIIIGWGGVSNIQTTGVLNDTNKISVGTGDLESASVAIGEKSRYIHCLTYKDKEVEAGSVTAMAYAWFQSAEAAAIFQG